MRGKPLDRLCGRGGAPKRDVVARPARTVGVGLAPCLKPPGTGQGETQAACRHRQLRGTDNKRVAGLRGQVGEHPSASQATGAPASKPASPSGRLQSSERSTGTVMRSQEGRQAFGPDHLLLELQHPREVELEDPEPVRPSQPEGTRARPAPRITTCRHPPAQASSTRSSRKRVLHGDPGGQGSRPTTSLGPVRPATTRPAARTKLAAEPVCERVAPAGCVSAARTAATPTAVTPTAGGQAHDESSRQHTRRGPAAS